MASGRFENQMNFPNVVFGPFAIGKPSSGSALRKVLKVAETALCMGTDGTPLSARTDSTVASSVSRSVMSHT